VVLSMAAIIRTGGVGTDLSSFSLSLLRVSIASEKKLSSGQ
jgi:hypothetical protein